jgi:hypothetical protein
VQIRDAPLPRSLATSRALTRAAATDSVQHSPPCALLHFHHGGSVVKHISLRVHHVTICALTLHASRELLATLLNPRGFLQQIEPWGLLDGVPNPQHASEAARTTCVRGRTCDMHWRPLVAYKTRNHANRNRFGAEKLRMDSLQHTHVYDKKFDINVHLMTQPTVACLFSTKVLGTVNHRPCPGYA